MCSDGAVSASYAGIWPGFHCCQWLFQHRIMGCLASLLDDYDSASRAHAVRGINSMLAARGLTMAVYHPEQVRQYPVNIASPSAYIRKKSLDFMRRSIEDAAAFSAPIMILAPGWVFVDDFTQADTQRAVESIQQLAEWAAGARHQPFVQHAAAPFTLGKSGRDRGLHGHSAGAGKRRWRR